MERCIFCPNPRTHKRGEHVWDDWLNREGGKDIKDKSTTFYYGSAGEFIRSHPSTRIDVTVPVVCDKCNNEWMSDISTLAKERLEPIIRRNEPRDFDEEDILVLTAFAFLKSAVLDWSSLHKGRKPCLSRTACVGFRNSLTSASVGDIAFPLGLQVWIARWQRTHRMEAQAFIEEMTGGRQFKGYRILVITYLVGSFVFQLTYPRWSKVTRNRPPAPFLAIPHDVYSVPIWPDVNLAYWPPLAHIDSARLKRSASVSGVFDLPMQRSDAFGLSRLVILGIVTPVRQVCYYRPES